MPEKNQWKQGCPAKCDAENPEIIIAPAKEIPAAVWLQIGDQPVYKCQSCFTYWIEPTDKVHKIRHKIIGYHEWAPGRDGNYWLTEDGKFQKLP
jgi:hypothetical protein